MTNAGAIHGAKKMPSNAASPSHGAPCQNGQSQGSKNAPQFQRLASASETAPRSVSMRGRKRVAAPVEAVRVEVYRVGDDVGHRRLHALLLEYEAGLPPDLRHGIVGDLQAVRAQYADPNAAFVAADATAAAGCICVTRLDPTTAVVMRLYVRDSHRGRGLARRLVATALSFSRAAGYERAVLDTDKERLGAAYALYRSLGFAECAPYGPVDYASPTYMELDLR